MTLSCLSRNRRRRQILKRFTFDRSYSRILHLLTKFRENRTIIRYRVIAKTDVLQHGVRPPSWIVMTS